MMRRGFWLVVGVVLGVAGYRRASRLGRLLSARVAAPQLAAPKHAAVRQLAAPKGGAGARIAAPGRAAGALLPGTGVAQPGYAARLRSAASFVRDVREGMAEYRDLRRDELGRTLGSQRDRTESGASQQGRVEP
jgi:hypothetical protein